VDVLRGAFQLGERGDGSSGLRGALVIDLEQEGLVRLDDQGAVVHNRPSLRGAGEAGDRSPSGPRLCHREQVRNDVEPLFTRAFVALGVAELAYFTAVGVSLYALPLFVTGPVGGSEAAPGYAFGVFSVSAVVLRPYAGRMADSGGRRPLLLGGALLAALGLVATAYVDSLAANVVIRQVLGVAEAAFFVSAFAVLADLAPESRMGEALSYNSLGLYLGLALGPPLGEAIEHWSGFDAAWWAAGGLAALAALISLLVPETRAEPEPDAGPPALIHWPAVPISLAFMTSLLAVGGFLAFAALHAEDIDFERTSVPLLTYGLVVVFCRVVFAGVPDRVPSLPLGAASLVAIAVGIAAVALWQEPVGMVVGVVVMAVGVAFCTPAFFSAIFATASSSERGAAAGTASIVLDLGLGLGPILLGLLADGAGIPWAFGAAAAIALFGAFATLALSARSRPNPDPVDLR
jgi:predicted MFS family arabinose efflux permease